MKLQHNSFFLEIDPRRIHVGNTILPSTDHVHHPTFKSRFILPRVQHHYYFIKSNDPSYYITPTPSPLIISSFPCSINLLNFQIKSLKTLSQFCSLQWRLRALSRQFLLCVSPIQSSRLLHLLKPKDC